MIEKLSFHLDHEKLQDSFECWKTIFDAFNNGNINVDMKLRKD